jgi:glyoxylase-like metal-dependent hydrolase (beta-lactamase superfamily II)
MRVTPWLYLVGSRQFGLSSPYDCHIYALRSASGILVIDAGSGLGEDRVLANLREEFGSDLGDGAILITHKHPDHAAGAGGLSKALGWPVWTSELTRPFVEAGVYEPTVGYPVPLPQEPCRVAGSFADGSRIELAGFTLRAIHVRGHSEDSFAFLFEHAGVRGLICADILFYGGVLGVINTGDSGMQGYRADLGKLADLGVDALLPGHGLFTLSNGQQHIDAALASIEGGFVPRLIGQGDLIF